MKYTSDFSDRVYAAIHLRVPDSGDPELDAMIRKAQRYELAKMVLCANLASPRLTTLDKKTVNNPSDHSLAALICADAMIEEMECENKNK